MTEVILGQIRFILFMLCGGMALMFGYDGLRLLRWIVPHSKFMVALQDILYWCAMSVPTFALFFYLHDGQIRWYGLVALFAGIAVYEFGISSPARSILSKKLEPLRNRIRRGIRRCFRQIWSLLQKIHSVLVASDSQNKEM